MNKNPEVSIIIPTYNRADLISRAIWSVLNQTFQDFEIIVVDDNSTDTTEEVVRSFDDPRIRYFKHKINKGAGAARNTGIKIAKGKYITFLDSDDEWLPEKLEKQIEKIKKVPTEVGVIYTGYWIIMDGRKMLGKIPKKRGDIFEDELFGDWISPTPCVLIKRECFEKVGGFDEKLPAREDYEMWLRISRYFHFDYIKEPLVNMYFYYHPERLAFSGSEKHILAEEQILKKYEKEIQSKSKIEQNKIFSSHYYNLGKRCWENKDVSLGRKFFVKAIKLYPFKINYFLLFIASLLGNKFYDTLSVISKKVRTITNIKSW